MAEIIDIFSKQPVLQKATPPPKHKPISDTPGKVTQADLEATKDHDFRGEWKTTLVLHKQLGLNLNQIRKHQVHLSDVGKAVAISAILKHDKEAAEYFIGLSAQMTATQQFYTELGQIPDSFKGYVWAIDFQKIINAAAFVEYQLGGIIGRPIVRHIFF